jgi:hypothetical protein
MFRSAVTLFPSSGVTTGVPGLFEGESSIVNFGDEEATEKVLQILMSDRINDYLADKYKLVEHYGIDPNSRYLYTLLAAKMSKNINFRKTMYQSVEISVLDANPAIAANIANDIASMVDTIFNEMINEAGKKYYSVLQSQYQNQEKLVMALEDSLFKDNIWQQAITGFNPAINRLRGEPITRDVASPYSPVYLRFSSGHASAIEDLAQIRQKLTQTEMSALEKLPYTMVLNRARISEKKAFPNRSSIVIISTFSALISLFVIMVIVDGIRITARE